jgi:2-hydroxychromene-2-carboxylate isomerase
MVKDIDFFFFIGTTYIYLTVMRIDRIVADVGVQVRWRPFNVRQIMIEQHNIPFRGKPERMRYMWRDVRRRAERYNIRFTMSRHIRSMRTTWPTVSACEQPRRGGVLAMRKQYTEIGS